MDPNKDQHLQMQNSVHSFLFIIIANLVNFFLGRDVITACNKYVYRSYQACLTLPRVAP